MFLYLAAVCGFVSKIFPVHCQHVGNCGFDSLLDLWHLFGPEGANQSDIYPNMVLSSGLSVNSKPGYGCFVRN